MVRLIIDSGSDITQAEAKEWDIDVLPLKISFGDTEYLDGISISHEQFFNMLIEAEALPTTSQVSPYDYEQVFEKVVSNGDTAVCITVAGTLSGCYQSAMIAASNSPDKVIVVDSENVCIAQRVLMQSAIKKRDAGMTAKEIADELEVEKKNLIIIARLNTLEYLKKGGRISATTAGVGTLLSIKPVVTVKDGVIVLLGAARGSKNANNKLVECVTNAGGIDFSRPFALAHSGLSDVDLNKYIEDSKALYSEYSDELPCFDIGAAIGTHIGPGAVALAFWGKNNN